MSVDPTNLSPQTIYGILYKNHPEYNPYNSYSANPYMSHVIQLNIGSLNEEESIPYFLNPSEQSLYTINLSHYLNDTYIPYDTYPWSTFYPTTQVSYNQIVPYTTGYDMWDSIYFNGSYNNGNQTYFVNEELQEYLDSYVTQLNEHEGQVCKLDKLNGIIYQTCGDKIETTIKIDTQGCGISSQHFVSYSKEALDCSICMSTEYGICMCDYASTGDLKTRDNGWLHSVCDGTSKTECALECGYSKEELEKSMIDSIMETLYTLLAELFSPKILKHKIK